MSLKREYWYIIIVYIAMQLSSIVGVPLLMMFGIMGGAEKNAELQQLSGAYWIVISFLIGLIATLYLIRKEMKNNDDFRKHQASVPTSIFWGFAGIFLALFSQSLAGMIETAIGIEAGSENTQTIIDLILNVPLVLFVSSVIGPILEEIVFRKIIFGSLHKRLNFFLSALISSLIFGAAHGEFIHLLLYTAMGFVFAFLYVKTNRILVPIFAHVSMNSLVVITQIAYKDDIEKLQKDAEHVQNFIGGFL